MKGRRIVLRLLDECDAEERHHLAVAAATSGNDGKANPTKANGDAEGRVKPNTKNKEDRAAGDGGACVSVHRVIAPPSPTCETCGAAISHTHTCPRAPDAHNVEKEVFCTTCQVLEYPTDHVCELFGP